jgi:hypothetical protein
MNGGDGQRITPQAEELFVGLWESQIISLLLKDLFIIYKYTVTVFRYPRRGHQILLWMVVSSRGSCL